MTSRTALRTELIKRDLQARIHDPTQVTVDPYDESSYTPLRWWAVP